MGMTYATMEKEAKRQAKYGMDPLPQDPRVERMYPGMGQSEKVLNAVERMREDNWDALNLAQRNNTPATEEEVQAWAESHPWADINNQDVLEEVQADLQRQRTQKMMYVRSEQVTHDEVQAAKAFMIGDGITPENRVKLEKAADAWHDEKGTWAGWEVRRLEMIKELSGE